MRELLERLEEGISPMGRKRVENKIANIPASAQKAAQQFTKGNIAGCMKSLMEILGDLSWVYGGLRSFDDEKFDEAGKYIDKAYSATNKMYRSLPTKAKFQPPMR